MKNRILPLFLSLFFFTTGYSQKWNKVDNTSFRSLEKQRLVTPIKYESYELDFDHFKSMLKNAPKRFESREKGITIRWPMPAGGMQKFRIKRSDVFHPDLAAKYPKIKAFTGYSLSDPTAILKISMSHKGIEGMLLSNRHETIYLDRYLPKTKGKYILYNRSDYHRELLEGEGTCTVEDPKDGYKGNGITERFGDCQLRKYKLAMACTGEYATFHGGNIPDVLAEFNASMVRVNGIYERDFTITMEFIPETDQLIFLNGATDPYTNNDGGAMLGQNQATIDQIIGFENYDIGHVFSTGGGGIASLRSPCTSRKARGVTGLGNPTGDPFWVDYVSHEIGHQFGGNHTQNNSCQRNNSTSVEPGSASTIMGYAGICSPNVQNNSDDYFHSVSQNEVANFVVAGNGNCAEIITIDNAAPEIESVTPTNLVFPSRTPFYLTVEATDSDNDMLTYCWEQIDNEPAQMPPISSSVAGPAFRSFDPSEDPTRYFPGLASVLLGINGSTWEVLPNADRDMSFNITVRDNNSLGGCTADEDLSVTFTSSAGPFLITSQNTSVTWNSGNTETITWDVAGTDVAPVSCDNADIVLSLDRGNNFDIILAENVPNDGEHDIIVPFEVTSQGRIMLKCSSKTFFDINNQDINIIAPFASQVSPSNISLCPNETATFMINHTVFGSDPLPVTYTLNGLPAGATYTFTPDQVEENTEITLTIDNLTNDLAGTYDLDIVAQGDMVALVETIILNLGTEQNLPVNYLSPQNGQIGVSTAPALSWDELNGVDSYEIEISENPKFIDIVFSSSTNDNFILPTGLNSTTVYYWRVRGVSNCTAPVWQSIRSFQTRRLECTTESVTANLVITADSENIIESEVEIIDDGILGNLEISLNIAHTWIGDLTATLKAPDGTEIIIFERPGIPESEFGCEANNIIATFSSSALNTAQDFENTCNLVGNGIEGIFQPLESFSAFENLPIAGIWTLIIEDSFDQDGGELVSWSIENCETIFLEPGVILNNNLLSLNNTTEGGISNTLLEMENNNPANTWFTIRNIPSYGEVQRMNAMSGEYESMDIGDTFSQEDINLDMIRYQLADFGASDDNFMFDAQDDQFRYISNNIFMISSSISALTISTAITNQISCFGETDARIEVMGMGGLPGYTYSINEGPFETQTVFENLGAGEYTIVVKDMAETEVASDILTIVEPDEITFIFFIGDNEITIDGIGGTGVLMYSLDNINYTTENTIEVFDGTTYRIYVTDENDCMTQSSNEMTFYQIGGADISTEDIDCKGNTNGSITITSVSGGQEPYTYQLNEETPTSENNFIDLPSDSYSIKIVGASGSEFTQMDILIAEPELELEITNEVVENTITLTATGGTAPYQYSLDGINFSENNIFVDLEDGEYMGYVMDANSCETSESSIIINTSTISPVLEQVNLFPNPTKSNFILGSNSVLSFNYQIIDITGKVINQGSTTSNSPISVEHFTPGLFLVKVTYEGSSKVFKLSKI